MENKFKLKKFLATASAVAMITGASSNALGNERTSVNDPSSFSIAGDWGGTAPADGDRIKLGNNNDAINADVALTLVQYDLNNLTPGVMTITKNLSIGSIYNQNGANYLPITFNANKTLIFTGTSFNNVNDNNYSGVGQIDFAAAGARILNINAANGNVIDLTNASVANANKAGVILDVDTNLITNSKSFFTFNKIDVAAGGSVTINAGASDMANDAASTYTMGDTNSTLKLSANANAADRAITLKSSLVKAGGGDDQFKLVIEAGGAANAKTLTVNANAAKTIGTDNANRITELRLEGANNITFGNNITVFAKKIVQAGTAKTTFTKAVDSGANSSLTFEAAGTVDFADDATIAKIDFNNVDGTVNFANNANFTGDIINTGGNNTGSVIFAQNSDVTGTIGGDGAALKLVQVTGAGDVDLQAANGAHYAQTFQFKDANAKIKVAAGGKLVGNLVAAKDGNGQVEFAGNGEIVGTIGDKVGNGLNEIISNGAGTVTIGAGDHKASFKAATDAAASFTFKNGANITGTIDNKTGGVNNTVLTFEGNSSVSGAIGATKAFNTVNIDAGTLTIAKAIQANSIKFGADENARLLYNTLADVNIGNAAGAIQTEKATRGIIEIGQTVAGKNVTFLSKIGDSANDTALRLLSLKQNDAASVVTLVGGSHIKKLASTGAATVKFNGNLRIAETELEGGNLVLQIDGAASKLMSVDGKGGETNYGTADNRFGALNFANNQELTFQDGVNLYAAALTNNANEGTLTFEGSSIFDTTANANKINAININGGKGKVVRIARNISANGNVTLNADSTLEAGGNLTAAEINGKAAGNGRLKFVNTAKSTLTGNVGATKTINVIEIAGSDVVLAGNITHGGKDIEFSSAKAATLTLNNNTAGNANFVNKSADEGIAHTVILAADTNLEGNIATADPVTRQIIINVGQNDKTATVQGNAAANGAMFVGKDGTGKGTVTLNKDGVTVYKAGTQANRLTALNVSKNATITNGVSAITTTIAKGITGTFAGTVEGTNFVLADAGSTANFSDNAILDVAVTATKANEGVVSFLGGGSVKKSIGTSAAKARTVNFADTADKVLILGANIHANDSISLKKTTTQLTNNVTLESKQVNATNASINLADKTLTISGGALKFAGNENKITSKITDNGNNVTGGKIVVPAGSTLDYNGAKLLVTPDDAGSSRPSAGATRIFTLIENSSGVAPTTAFDLANIAIDNTKNKLTKWTASVDTNGSLLLQQIDNAKETIVEALKAANRLDAADEETIGLLTGADSSSDAGKFVAVLGELVDNPVLLDDALERLNVITSTTDQIENGMGNVGQAVSHRVGSTLSGSQTAGTPVQSRSVASANVTGVAAGDDSARFGAWFSPFYSQTTQKSRKGTAGYKNTTYGGSLGADTRVNDDMIIGAALSFANSEAKHKDQKVGDKTKVNSVMLSIYGLQQITDTWFTQGSVTVGSNDVNNTEKRRTSLTTHETVKGKYSSMSFTGDVMFGYNYATEAMTLTPMAGLRYSRVNNAGYKESGSTTGQNLDVSQKASNKFEAILGARIASGTFDVNGMSVTPDAHAFINHDIIGKNAKVNSRIGGVAQSLATKGNKPVRTTYNVGLGVNMDYGMMEYGAGYDLHLANKRVGHEGTLKVRVNF